MDQSYQNVYIELNDGSVGLFTGPVLLYPENLNLHITNVRFGQPTPLPEEFRWEDSNESD